jgi:hypothetical protein
MRKQSLLPVVMAASLPPDSERKPTCHYTGKVCDYYGTDTTCTCTQPGFQGTPPTWTDVAADGVALPAPAQPSEGSDA